MIMQNTRTSNRKLEAENRIRDEKIKLMKERQSKWMSEKVNDVSRICSSITERHHNSPELKAIGGKKKVNPSPGDRKQSPQKSSKNDVLLWNSRSSTDYPDGFVVRSPDTSKGKQGKSKGRASISSSVHSNHTRGYSSSKGNREVAFSTSTLLGGSPLRYSTKTMDRKADFEADLEESRLEIPQRAHPKHELAEKDRNIYSQSESKYDSPTNLSNVAGEISNINLEKAPSRVLEDFSSHRCPSCSKLMEGSRNEPMICIPCGHSVCRSCASNVLLCPFCQCKIQSTSVNESLKTVISAYKDMRKKQELEEKEKQVRKYVEEYESLNMRSKFLQDEAECVIEDLEAITGQMGNKKEALKRLSVLAEEKRAKMEILHKELKECEGEHRENEEDLKALDKEYAKSKDRLDILEDTLDTICKSKDRVRVLINSLAPSLSFDDDN